MSGRRHVPGVVALSLFVASTVSACGTLGSDGEGDRALPSAGVGPFRAVGSREVPGVAPYVFDDKSAQYLDPAPVPDPASEDGVILFAAATRRIGDVPTSVLVRTRASDGRAFYGGPFDNAHTAPVVLVADAAWEGGLIRKPSVVVVRGTWFLYYAGKGGIGVATSTDGLVFTKASAPVLVATETGTPYDVAVPDAPSAAVFPDGSVHLVFAAGGAIIEARSDDGRSFVRVDADPSTPAIDPVLLPRGGVRADVDGGRAFDAEAVADPWLSLRTTEAGRFHVRVLYTGYGRAFPALGLAARYGAEGPLVRADEPLVTATSGVSRPSLVVRGAVAYLYGNLARAAAGGSTGIAAWVTPPSAVLATPAPVPVSP